MRRRFTLVELLIVVAILAILMGLLFPAISKAKDKAKSLQCLSNQRQISLALAAYGSDYNGFIVSGNTALNPYSSYMLFLCGDGLYIPPSSKDIFVCPAYYPYKLVYYSYIYGMRDPNEIYQGWNVLLEGNIYKSYFQVTRVTSPSTYWIGVDSRSSNGQVRQTASVYYINTSSTSGIPHLRHGGQCNMFFADSHATSMGVFDIWNLQKWQRFDGGYVIFRSLFFNDTIMER